MICGGGGPRGVVANALDNNIVENEFELQWCYYSHFRTKFLGKYLPSFSNNDLRGRGPRGVVANALDIVESEFSTNDLWGRGHRGVVANALDSGIVDSMFELHSCY